MATPTHSSPQRAPGELASQLHHRLLDEQFVAPLKAYVEGQKVKERRVPFTSKDELYARKMITLMLETPKRSFKVDIIDLVPEAREDRNKRRSPERFFAKIVGCPLLVYEAGKTCVRLKKFSLLPQVEEQLRFGEVEKRVRKAKGRRNQAHQAVLGHLPQVPKATKCRRTGESMPSADSRERRQSRQPGSAAATRSPQKIQKEHVTHEQYKQTQKPVALPVVSDAFKAFIPWILETLEGIPGRRALVPRSVLTLIANTDFSPEEFKGILTAAAKAAKENPEAQDHQREWVLACLSHPDWARKFLPPVKAFDSPTESIQAPATPPPAKGAPAEPKPAAIEDEITKLLMSRHPDLNAPGVRQTAKSLATALPRKCGGIAFLEHLVWAAEQRYQRRYGKSGNNEPGYGYILRTLEHPFQDVIAAAHRSFERYPNGLRDFWKPLSSGTSIDQDLAAYDPKLQALIRLDPKAKRLYDELRDLQAKCPAPDAPGFLDHYDAVRKTLQALVSLGGDKLGARAEELRKDLHGRLVESKLQEGTLVWKRAWDHRWSRIICEAWGISA